MFFFIISYFCHNIQNWQATELAKRTYWTKDLYTYPYYQGKIFLFKNSKINKLLLQKTI